MLLLGEQLSTTFLKPILSGLSRSSHSLVLQRHQLGAAPAVWMGHHRLRDEFALIEVLVALRLALAVAGDHVSCVEEDVPRIQARSELGDGGHGHNPRPSSGR